MVRATVGGFALLLGLPLAISAQEMPKTKKYENVKWYRIVNIDFKAGMADSAMKIWTDHYIPAMTAAGGELSRRFRHIAGEWDVTAIFPMPGGPTDLEYEVTPQGEKYMAALAKQEGGLAQARALQRRYNDMVLRSESYVAREQQGTTTATRGR